MKFSGCRHRSAAAVKNTTGCKSMTDSRDIVVVGGGIIGIAVAAALVDRGHDVTLVDRTGICEETSSGNAAALAFSDILPLAQKGMIGQVPRWLMDPLGPLSISPAYLPNLLPWLWKFWRAGRSANYQASVQAQAAMMRLAEREWMALMDRTGSRPLLREDGCLELYESEAEWQAAQTGWTERERFGIEFRHVRGTEVAELQPDLSDRFVAGTFVPGWKTVADPQRLGKAVWAHAEAAGARFLNGEVKDVELEGGKPQLRFADGRTLRAAALVIAAGAWSHRLARRFGDRIPLETERGYNTTLPAGAFDLKRQLVFSRHGFVVTPLEGGIRVGGAVEFAGLERPPNYARAKAMLEKASRFMPGLKTEGGREWMGYRPSLPDTLPVIGPSPSAPNVFYAFGHGHLGLTQSAATGRLIADLVAGVSPAIGLAPYRPDRF
ncbi:MAG: NAD(P)/FAD-dependent oxidoreductase [Rhizobiaceae bacterium]